MGISGFPVWSASIAVISLAAGVVWQTVCKSPPVWIKELSMLGQTRDRKLHGTAVVCGGSIAGIVTARILADHFDRVIIVDPEIADNEKPKTRIMQYYAVHFFLHLFVASARRLWPNFDDELLAAGGRLAAADPGFCYSGIPLITPYHDYPKDFFPDTLIIRRATVQKVLHTLLMKDATAMNVTLLAGTVQGLDVSGDMSSIHGVIVRKSDGTQMHLNDVAFVADCTGRTQAGLKWLKSAGFSLPGNLRCSYNGNLRYANLCFTVPPELEAILPIPTERIKVAVIYAYVQHIEYGSGVIGLLKTENNTMQLMLGDSGFGDGDLPRIASDVVPFICGLGVQGHAPIPSWFIETITILCKQGKPSFNNIKIPPQSYIQYHRLPAEALPSNFVAIGDAHIQLNPNQGQGFSKITLNGLALDSLLRSCVISPRGLPRDFGAQYFKRNATYTQGLWDVTKLHDYGTPSCELMEGETKDTGRLIRWLEVKILSAATQDVEVASALWHVRHLLAPNKILLAPTVLWKTLWARYRF